MFLKFPVGILFYYTEIQDHRARKLVEWSRNGIFDSNQTGEKIQHLIAIK